MDTRSGGRRRREVRLNRPLPQLVVVTDDDVISRRDFLGRAASVLKAGGARCALQIRGHGLAGVRLVEPARRLVSVARASGASLWINDRLDVALAVRADGVQLGSLGVPPPVARRLLGYACRVACSVHSAEEAAAAFQQGADLAVLGNVFTTPTHPGRPGLGAAELRRAAAGGRPILAIGGMSEDKVQQIIEAGAFGVAVLSGVWGAEDPARATERYLSALARAAAAHNV